MSTPAFTIRTMTRPDLTLAVEWAAAEGWNPGLHDADTFYATDPNGFFMGVLGDEPIGCISCVAYDQSFGFLGFYIVKPEHRGKGYGIQIWKHGMAYLGDRNIGLDGVVAQQDNYRKSGFELAYRNIRYEGQSSGTVRSGGRQSPEPSGRVELTDVPFAELLAYDRVHFPAQRPQFLCRWIHQPEGAALGFVRGQRLAGYGVIRASRRGCKIGPLFADDEHVAATLFQALTVRVPCGPIFLDIPMTNPLAVALAERHGMHVVFETARMYTKGLPAVPLPHVFGWTSFELG